MRKIIEWIFSYDHNYNDPIEQKNHYTFKGILQGAVLTAFYGLIYLIYKAVTLGLEWLN